LTLVTLTVYYLLVDNFGIICTKYFSSHSALEREEFTETAQCGKHALPHICGQIFLEENLVIRGREARFFLPTLKKYSGTVSAESRQYFQR